MARRRHRGNEVVVHTSRELEDGTEVDIEVECAVDLGTPDRGPDFGCAGGYPGDPPEVEIIEAEGSDGKDYREAIESDAAWFDRVFDEAIEAASEDDSPYDTREEARGER